MAESLRTAQQPPGETMAGKKPTENQNPLGDVLLLVGFDRQVTPHSVGGDALGSSRQGPASDENTDLQIYNLKHHPKHLANSHYITSTTDEDLLMLEAAHTPKRNKRGQPTNKAPSISAFALLGGLLSATGSAQAQTTKVAATTPSSQVQHLEKDVAEAKNLAVASADIAAAADAKARAARAEAADIRSGKLIRYGVTAGIAFSAQTPWPYRREARQKNAELTTIPYVLFVPGYWIIPEATSAYCASKWIGTDSSSARRAAQAAAEGIASGVLDCIESRIRGGASSEATAGDCMPKIQTDAPTLVDRIRAEALNGILPAEERPKWRDIIKNHIWNPSKAGSCGLTTMGAWIGKPFSYDVESTVRESDASVPSRAEREFEPTIAFGLAFTPSAYLALMIGVTYGTIRQSSIARATDGTGGVEGRELAAWAGSVALGGNLDLLGALLK